MRVCRMKKGIARREGVPEQEKRDLDARKRAHEDQRPNIM